MDTRALDVDGLFGFLLRAHLTVLNALTTRVSDDYAMVLEGANFDAEDHPWKVGVPLKHGPRWL